jgi:pyrroloquinoline quinone (PQQ) biosynthesis protein C
MIDLVSAMDREADALVRAMADDTSAQRLIHGAITKDEYIHFLTQSYYYVCQSSSFLRRAGERLDGALGSLLKQKAAEERGHEGWILSDLEALGGGVEQVERASPSAAVSAYIAWNRFTCEAGPPAAILGTAYVLEHLSAARAAHVAERLVNVGAIPGVEQAVQFLKRHGDADTGHIQQLTSALSALRGDERASSSILLSARITRELYLSFFSADDGAAPPRAEVASPSAVA